MKRSSLCLTLLVLVGCSNSPNMPTPIASAAVSVTSAVTGATTMIVLAATDPQPPSCAWRDLVIKTHMDLGGSRNDIVTLANLHQVYLVETGTAPFYRASDYPGPWCA